MRKHLILGLTCLAAVAMEAAPLLPEQLQLRVTVQPSFDLSIAGNSMFNPRFFDGKIYANQINNPCFGRYPSGSSSPEMLVNNSGNNPLEHRMVVPFRGANRTNYLLGSSSAAAATTTFARYDFDGNNPITVDSPDAQTVDAFDWVDDDTIIYAIYNPSANRKRLCLADVVAEPFAVTKNTTWNANGYLTTGVSTRIRNVRKGDVYSGYAYYGDAGVATANFYALNLATGAETLLGSVSGLTGATTSYGLWTVVERDGYLYVQTSDNGIYVYSMANATTLGTLFTTYTKTQLDAITGGSSQYFGLDVTRDGKKLLLGGLGGNVYELEGLNVPYQPEQVQLRVTYQPSLDLGIAGNSMFNPRFFDGKVYANQINTPCFGRYASGSAVPEVVVNNSGDNTLEHRMVAPFRGANRKTYLIGSSSAAASTKTFTRYFFDGSGPTIVESPDILIVDAFDWVDDDTVIYAVYTAGSRNKLYLADVVAEPFAVTLNTTWNASGFIATSASRIRNVRKGDLFSGYAYYGDAGVATAKFYALNLATGAETLLGSVSGLTGATSSYGLWTVVERDGYLYVQTTDNGIYVYSMVNATTLGSLVATYTKGQMDALTGGSTQYFGLDVSPNGRNLLLGGLEGKVYELEGRTVLTIAKSKTDVALSWPATAGPMVLQSSASLSADFVDMDPQPAVVQNEEMNTVTLPLGTASQFFRLRKAP